MLYDLYQIIPKIDSTSFMCVSKDGLSHFSITKDRKCEPLTDGYKLIFDNETGKALAAARCNVKVAVKRVKNAHKKWSESVQAYIDAERHMHAMAKYYEDSADRQKIAEAQLEYLLNTIKEG